MSQLGIASLGMYAFTHVCAANDTFWTLTRGALGYGPQTLTRDMAPWDVWQHPNLVFAQTCGLPYRKHLHDKVQLVGTPDYGIDGCPAGHYNSVIVVPKASRALDINSLSGQRLAYNEGLSQSGWAAPTAHFAAAGVSFKKGPCTGGHKFSAQAVAQGTADFAALDALTWSMLQIDDPTTTDQLRVIATTAPTPALPFITSAQSNAHEITAAVSYAITKLPEPARLALPLKGLVQIPTSAYLAIPNPATP